MKDHGKGASECANRGLRGGALSITANGSIASVRGSMFKYADFTNIEIETTNHEKIQAFVTEKRNV